MEVEAYQGRRGRKVVALKISNEFYPREKVEVPGEPVPMINYLED